MRYGYFDDAHREYVITRPDTPLPWINYLGSQAYFGLISNTAGGYSFYRDARLRRITRYRYNNVPFDFGGRYVYVRDNESSEFWSPSWLPTRSDLDDYSCRHGMGYTTIASSKNGVEVSTRYFVPLDQNLEVWLGEGDQPSEMVLRTSRCSQRWSSVSGTLSTMPPTYSATSTSVRWRLRMT